MSDKPHHRIDIGSREMDLLLVFPEDYETLETIRQRDPNETTDTQLHFLSEWGFVRRRKRPGAKVEYKLTALGLAVRKYYKREHGVETEDDQSNTTDSN